jgi:hypothetical protein
MNGVDSRLTPGEVLLDPTFPEAALLALAIAEAELELDPSFAFAGA